MITLLLKYDRFSFDMDTSDLLFVAISGSHAYGTARPDSDIDLRAVKLPHLRDITTILANPNKVYRHFENKGTPQEVDVEVVPIVRWLRTLLKGNGNYLENIYQEKMYESGILKGLKELIEEHAISKRFAGHYLGFAKSQRKDFYQKWKAKCLLYTYRVLMSGIVMFRDGKYEHNLYTLMEYEHSDYLPALMDKYVSEKSLINDKVKWEMEKEFDRLAKKLIKYRDMSELPDEPNYKVFDDWLYGYYAYQFQRA